MKSMKYRIKFNYAKFMFNKEKYKPKLVSICNGWLKFLQIPVPLKERSSVHACFFPLLKVQEQLQPPSYFIKAVERRFSRFTAQSRDVARQV